MTTKFKEGDLVSKKSTQTLYRVITWEEYGKVSGSSLTLPLLELGMIPLKSISNFGVCAEFPEFLFKIEEEEPAVPAKANCLKCKYVQKSFQISKQPPNSVIFRCNCSVLKRYFTVGRKRKHFSLVPDCLQFELQKDTKKQKSKPPAKQKEIKEPDHSANLCPMCLHQLKSKTHPEGLCKICLEQLDRLQEHKSKQPKIKTKLGQRKVRVRNKND